MAPGGAPAPGVDVHGREAASSSCLRTAGPDSGRGERGIRVEAPGRGERPAPVKPYSGLTNLISRPPAAGSAQSREVDIRPGPGYLYFMRGRVDSEPEAGDPMPHGKSNFLSLNNLGG